RAAAMMRARVCSADACRCPSRYCLVFLGRDFMELDTPFEFDYTMSTVKSVRRRTRSSRFYWGVCVGRDSGCFVAGNRFGPRLDTTMATQADQATFPTPQEDRTPQPVMSAAPVWPPIVLLALFWVIYSVWRWTELGISLGFMGFLLLVGIGALVTLLFATWWMAASKVSWTERFLVFGVAIAGGFGGAVLGTRLFR